MSDAEIREQLQNILQKAPKPQLHLHLDGSLSFSFIQDSIKRYLNKGKDESKIFFEKDWEPQNHDELRKWLMDLKQEQLDGGSVVKNNSNWKVFDFCNQFLQTHQDLFSMTNELVTSLNKQHGVNYIEIRFAPVLHTLDKLTETDAVRAVASGFKQAVADLEKDGVEVAGGIILCALRSYPIEKAFETVDLCCSDESVLGFDIAGDEGSFPLILFKDVLLYAKAKGCRITAHAGEWNELDNPSIIENVKLAIESSVDRIGHGLALRSCGEEVFDNLVKKNISVEVCLTANCANSKKCKSFAEHPVPLMLSKGVHVSALNVDNLLLSGNLQIGAPNPTKECIRALLDCRISPTQLMFIIRRGYEAGFARDKKSIIQTSLEQWQDIYLPQLESILNKSNIK